MRGQLGAPITELVPRQEPTVIAASGVFKAFGVPGQRVTTVKERVLRPLAAAPQDRLQALHDINFTVQQGEFFGVMGRNGSGKSTLLRCLAGIYPVDAGSIAIEGRVAPFIELGVGFNAELPASDNIVANAVVFGLSRREAEERCAEILAFAELEQFADQKLKNFSSGMGVRLAFACTIHVDADVFLFDEVLAVGDAGFTEKCFAHFDRLRAEGKTIVFVTHGSKTVADHCDRALLLSRGAVVDIGAAESIAEQYKELNARGSPLFSAPTAGPLPARPAELRSSALRTDPRRLVALVALLASMDFKLKYLDAKLSYLWAVGRPLARFGVMLLVFTHLGRFNEGVRNYPVYLLMSVVLWTYFSQATEASVSTLVRRADFLRKLPFPPLALPLAHIVVSFIDLIANLIVVFAFALIYGVVPRPGWLELIPIVAVLTIFATAFALFLSAAFVRHRDVDQIWGVVISAAFYATPIFYAASSVPGGLRRALVLFNPVATALTEARHAVIDPSAPSAAAVAGGYPWLLVPLGVVLAAVAAGCWMFGRESPWAAENV